MRKTLISFLPLVFLGLPEILLASASVSSTASSLSDRFVGTPCQILGLGTQGRQTTNRPLQGQTNTFGSDRTTDGGGDLLPIPWGDELPLPPAEIAAAISGKWIIAQPKCGTYLSIEFEYTYEGNIVFHLKETYLESGEVISSGYGAIQNGVIHFWLYSELMGQLFEIQISVFNKDQFPRSHWDKDYFWCDKSDQVFILRFVGPNTSGSFTLKRP